MIDLDRICLTPKELLLAIAKNEKAKRKQLGYTQEELARRSGVSLPSLRRFEQTGEVSLSSLLEIAIVLGDQNGFLNLFPQLEYRSMEELLNAENKKSRRIRK